MTLHYVTLHTPHHTIRYTTLFHLPTECDRYVDLLDYVAAFQEAFINTVVAVEVGCWFFVGECIGKGTLIGYQVHPRAANFGLDI